MWCKKRDIRHRTRLLIVDREVSSPQTYLTHLLLTSWKRTRINVYGSRRLIHEATKTDLSKNTSISALVHAESIFEINETI